MDAKKLKDLQEIATRFLGFGKAKPDPAKPEPKTDNPDTPPAKPEKFEQAKVKGSETVIEYDPTLEVGSPVMQSSGTGSTPAQDGSITLDNGISFTVADGKIASVESDGKAPAEGDDQNKEDFAALIEAAKTELRAEFAELLKPVQESYEALKPTIEALPTNATLEAFTTNLNSIGEFVQQFAEIPVETPITKAGDKDVSRDQMFENVAAGFSKQGK